MARHDKVKQPGIGQAIKSAIRAPAPKFGTIYDSPKKKKVINKPNQRGQAGQGGASISNGNPTVFTGVKKPEDVGKVNPYAQTIPQRAQEKSNNARQFLGDVVKNAGKVLAGPFTPAGRDAIVPFTNPSRAEQVGRDITSSTTITQSEALGRLPSTRGGVPAEGYRQLDEAIAQVDALDPKPTSIKDSLGNVVQGVNKFVDPRTGATLYSDKNNYEDASRFEGPRGANNLDEQGNIIDSVPGGGIGPTVNIEGNQYGVNAAYEVFGKPNQKTIDYNNDNPYLNEILSQPSSFAPTNEELKFNRQAVSIKRAMSSGQIGFKTGSAALRKLAESRQDRADASALGKANFRDNQATVAAGNASTLGDIAKADATTFAANEKTRVAFAKMATDLEIQSQKGQLDGNTMFKTLNDYMTSEGATQEGYDALLAKGRALLPIDQRRRLDELELSQLNAEEQASLGN